MTTSLDDPEVLERLERAVEEAEERSGIECVVVLAPRAGDYRFYGLATGVAAAFLWLVLMVYVPAPLPEELALAAVVCVASGVGWAASSAGAWLRLVVPAGLRRARAERLARALFVEEAMTGTRDRSGLLFVYAALERELVLVPDVGIRRAAPPEVLPEIERVFHHGTAPFVARLEAALRLAGELLSEAVPHRRDDTDELPNEVRVLSTGNL